MVIISNSADINDLVLRRNLLLQNGVDAYALKINTDHNIVITC